MNVTIGVSDEDLDEKLVGEERKQAILDHIEDLISNFMYYDRKEDDELPRGSIEEAIKADEITVDEIVAQFKKQLERSL